MPQQDRVLPSSRWNSPYLFYSTSAEWAASALTSSECKKKSTNIGIRIKVGGRLVQSPHQFQTSCSQVLLSGTANQRCLPEHPGHRFRSADVQAVPQGLIADKGSISKFPDNTAASQPSFWIGRVAKTRSAYALQKMGDVCCIGVQATFQVENQASPTFLSCPVCRKTLLPGT